MNDPLSRRAFLKAAAYGAGTSFGSAAYGRAELQWLEMKETDFFLPRWTHEAFRVAFFADSHLTEQAAVSNAQKAVQWALKQNPNMILFGGDFIEDIKHGVDHYMEPAFGAIKNCGIPAFAVLGNHDYGSADPEKVIWKAEQLGFNVLRNQAVMVQGVTLVGLDSRSFNYTQPEVMDQYRNEHNVICMVHEPDVALEVQPDTCSIMLAGHSHGGQVCLPFGIPIHTPLYAKVYKVGYYPEAPNPLFVTRGLGATGVHVRTFCRPQAHILHLRRIFKVL